MEFGERKRRRKSQSFKLITDEGRLLNECKTLQDARLCLGVCLALCASRDDSVNKSDGHDNAHSLRLGFHRQLSLIILTLKKQKKIFRGIRFYID